MAYKMYILELVTLGICSLSTIQSSSSSISTLSSSSDYQANEGDLRLVNGQTSHNGRVEVYYNATWGTICGDSFGMDDAHVICRALGFPRGAHKYHKDAHFGQGTGPIWLDNLHCTSHSTNIQSCQAEWGSYGCTHQDDIGVTCLTDSTVRLKTRGASNRGRPEVFYSGEWGTICADNFNITDANILCNAIGYQGAATANGGSFFGDGSGPIWLDELDCSSATNLASCRSQGWGIHDCSHSNDAGLICLQSGSVRLSGYTSSIYGAVYAGRVEVFYENQWGTICDDDFDFTDANLICRLLGYHRARSYRTNAGYGQGSGPIWRDELDCTPTSSDLFECGGKPWGSHNCSHREDVGVYCTNYPRSTCEKTVGERWDSSQQWSDEKFAQAAISGLRVWKDEYVNNIQVRYGDTWAPRHPEHTVGAMTEYLFQDNERLMRVRGGHGWVINQLLPETNQHVYGTLETGNGISYDVGGYEILYLNGSVFTHVEQDFVSGLSFHISECSNDSFVSSHFMGDLNSDSMTDAMDSKPNGTIRLADGSSQESGRVEVYYNNQWGTICDDEFSIEDAEFICRVIGFPGANAAHGSAYFGEGSGPILGDKLACDVNSTDILSCMQQGWGQHNCTHKQDAGVTCRSLEAQLDAGSSPSHDEIEDVQDANVTGYEYLIDN